jgi:hypothetical protein
MSASDFDLHLVELQNKSVGRLMSAEVFDAVAFAELKTYLCEKAELIKDEHVVSKQVIACLLEAASVIESRSAYIEEARRNIKMSADFYYLLSLIAIGEGCNDRRPGVPRII